MQVISSLGFLMMNSVSAQVMIYWFWWSSRMEQSFQTKSATFDSFYLLINISNNPSHLNNPLLRPCNNISEVQKLNINIKDYRLSLGQYSEPEQQLNIHMKPQKEEPRAVPVYVHPPPPFPESLFANPRPYPQQRLVYFDGKIYPQTVNEPNIICNSRYTWKSFFPLVLYHQFQYFFNLFFLIIALSQFINMLKVGFLVSYLAPLLLVLGFTLLKEAYDDRNRKARDLETNTQKYTLFRKTGKEEIMAMDMKVGDIIEVKSNQRVPADMVILATDDPEGSVFIRTDQLDGETDWKLRKAVRCTQKHNENWKNILGMSGIVDAQAPKLDIYNFEGVFKIQNPGIDAEKENKESRQGLSLHHTLWGNCYLANGKAIGIIIYTGREMRSMMNTKDAKDKMGRTDGELNYLSKLLFGFMCVLAVIIVAVGGFGEYWLLNIFRQVLLLSSIIPISLRVNLDLAKTIFSYRINHDPKIEGTIARNSQIPEELGRVHYILSDKTGTLTQNQMIFKKISVSEVGSFEKHQEPLLAKIVEKGYLQSSGPMADVEEKIKAASLAGKKLKYIKRDKQNMVRDFVDCLALCHNVTPSIENEQKVYQASSPDEIALVKIAERLGVVLVDRKASGITVVNPMKQREVYKVEAIFPFTSESKRMGIIVRHVPTNRVIFYLKGADTIMKEKVPETLRAFILDECEDLSRNGLRTLVLAQKYLTEQVYQAWSREFADASALMVGRDAAVKKVIESLQEGMDLLGITGVEDKLQEDIMDTLQNLRYAGISVWMITGDKIETAICIAISAGLKSPTQDLYVIKQESDHYGIQSKLNEFSVKTNTVLVIDGISINTALTHQREFFFTVAANAPAVVCCRTSPTQKATITEGVKHFTGKVVLGIGDGGNDVGMIQTADIGVGIVGKEGKQAALASDFSILKFKYLSQLLLWHGRLAYKNTSVMAQFVIHRGLIISIIQTIFSLVFYSIAIPIYNGYLMLGYSTVYTMFPVFCIIFDQDVDQDKVKQFPQLYQSLQKGRELNYKTFLIWVWKSIYQGAVIMFFAFTIFDDSFVDIVTITFTSLIVIEIFNVYTTLTRMSKIVLVSQIFTIVIYILSIIFFREFIDVSRITSTFCFKVLLIVLVSWGPMHIAKILRTKYDPTENEKIMKRIKTK